ncbi:MAG: glycosyltransferase family 4 protein, partial [Spirochaetaceae bacterium]|nr:glycosyltransferase family 4 protein [Spirochaetaceae bacterium]
MATRIGIDTFGCDHGRSGIGSYVRSFVTSIPPETHAQIELFGPEIDRYTYNSERRDILFRGISLPDNLRAERMWHSFFARGIIKKARYDVVLYAAATRVLPPPFKIPSVAVVNDVFSKNLFSADGYYYEHIKARLAKASRIIAVSQYIQKDLVNLGFDLEKITVIYAGIEHNLFYPRNKGDEAAVDIKPFAIRKPYLIYPSRVYGTSKKHVELVRAFNLFKAKTGLPHRLVLAGAFGSPGLDLLTGEIAQSPYACDIFLTGYFPHASLPLLYANADACVFPAQQEGIGLPVIEAMTCGIPVTCARSGALPEMTGGHAHFFDCDSVEDMALAMEKILEDTAFREKLIADGIAWTNRFSWK